MPREPSLMTVQNARFKHQSLVDNNIVWCDNQVQSFIWRFFCNCTWEWRIKSTVKGLHCVVFTYRCLASLMFHYVCLASFQSGRFYFEASCFYAKDSFWRNVLMACFMSLQCWWWECACPRCCSFSAAEMEWAMYIILWECVLAFLNSCAGWYGSLQVLSV